MAITNLTHSCVIITAERQVVGGVYWRVRAGCIPNCSARSVIDAMASNLREGAAPAPGALLLFADTAILLSLLFGCCGVDRTIRFDSIVMAAPSAPGGGHVMWPSGKIYFLFLATTSSYVDLLHVKSVAVSQNVRSYVRFGLAYPSDRCLSSAG